VALPDHDCPYLEGRIATSRAFVARSILPIVYHQLMDSGFRRSGRLIYQPVCRGCRQCVPIRVPVETFRASKSQRRCLRKNADLQITIAPARSDGESLDLYTRYVREWFGRSTEDDNEDRDSFESFLYDSPVETIQFRYRDGSGKLLAVGICDVCERSLSSVYFYHDPAQRRRGLGTFGALIELDWARSNAIAYYYLGYFVCGCTAMSYKASFRPNELLRTDGVWCAPDTDQGSTPKPGKAP
jgi:arginine-tRNA-protein transferase